MDTHDTHKLLEKNLKIHLQEYMPAHPLHEAYFYALLPAGKLFRPKLAVKVQENYQGMSAGQAISQPHNPLSYLCSAIEIHHAYTLVHDDLPAMDDDDMRRGQLSTHKKYGEWQAILVGDGLLNISYGLLAKIKHPQALTIIALAAKMLGPKGLIHGQVLDLSHEMNTSFEKCLQTHFAKTARLIQFSLLSSALLQSKSTLGLDHWKRWLRFGQSLGILFQFLDDLTELADETLSSHEEQVSPWIRFWEATNSETQKHLDYLIHESEMFKKMDLAYYFQAIDQTIKNDQNNILKHLKKKEADLAPVVTRLNILCQA